MHMGNISNTESSSVSIARSDLLHFHNHISYARLVVVSKLTFALHQSRHGSHAQKTRRSSETVARSQTIEVRGRESTGTQASVNFYILNFFRLPEHCSELKTTTASSIQISRSSIRSSKTGRSPASRSSSSDRPSSPGLSSASGGWSASLQGCASAGCIGHLQICVSFDHTMGSGQPEYDCERTWSPITILIKFLIRI